MKMKNKKKLQEEERSKRKQERRNQKDLENISRKSESLEEKPYILIVSEGENTEPSYFRQFKLSTANIKAVGEGYNTVSLIERADKLSKLEKYDQVWCVFDKDDFSDQNFNEAINKANNLGFKVAYSNQAFEYWIILHFNDHNHSHLHRSAYKTMINGYLSKFGVLYEDNKIITKDIFNILRSYDHTYNKNRTDLAIERSKRSIKTHNKSPAKCESSTNVYELVELILKYV